MDLAVWLPAMFGLGLVNLFTCLAFADGRARRRRVPTVIGPPLLGLKLAPANTP